MPPGRGERPRTRAQIDRGRRRSAPANGQPERLADAGTPLRILYVCADLGVPVLGRKGASVHVRGLVGALSRAGHSVVVAASLLEKSPWDDPEPLDASVLHVPPGAETRAAVAALRGFDETLGAGGSLPGELRRILVNEDLRRELRHRFREDPPDFVYERLSLYGTAGAVLARELGVPLMLELNAPMAVEQAAYRTTGLGDLAGRAERWALSQADVVVAVSSPLREYAVSLGVDADRVHLVPNGVDGALFHPGPPDPDVRVRWGLDGGPVIGFIGGLRPWHGVENLPPLLARLLPRHPGLRLVVVGHGPLRGELERELRQRGLLDSVVLTGSLPQADVAALLREFDVAIAPYPRLDHEFYFSPLKLFEYMACGAAVVAPAVGQISEVVRHGETGLLYEPAELDALARACERLLGDDALRRRLGAAAAELVRGSYTWDDNAARVVELARPLVLSQGR